jgi:hypothetical protein
LHGHLGQRVGIFAPGREKTSQPARQVTSRTHWRNFTNTEAACQRAIGVKVESRGFIGPSPPYSRSATPDGQSVDPVSVRSRPAGEESRSGWNEHLERDSSSVN